MTPQAKANPANHATLLALLGGLALGAVVTALTTPKTGQEVREKIRTTARRIRGKGTEPEIEEEDLDSGTMEALFI